MDKFMEHVLPNLEDDYIRYYADGINKSTSTNYFRSNFKRVAAIELPNIGQRYYYYQNNDDPDLVMRFRISQHVGISASLMIHSDFLTQLKAMQDL